MCWDKLWLWYFVFCFFFLSPWFVCKHFSLFFSRKKYSKLHKHLVCCYNWKEISPPTPPILEIIRKNPNLDMITPCDIITMGWTKMQSVGVWSWVLTGISNRNAMVSLIPVFEIGSFHICSESPCCRLYWGNKRWIVRDWTESYFNPELSFFLWNSFFIYAMCWPFESWCFPHTDVSYRGIELVIIWSSAACPQSWALLP